MFMFTGLFKCWLQCRMSCEMQGMQPYPLGNFFGQDLGKFGQNMEKFGKFGRNLGEI